MFSIILVDCSAYIDKLKSIIAVVCFKVMDFLHFQFNMRCLRRFLAFDISLPGLLNFFFINLLTSFILGFFNPHAHKIETSNLIHIGSFNICLVFNLIRNPFVIIFIAWWNIVLWFSTICTGALWMNNCSWFDRILKSPQNPFTKGSIRIMRLWMVQMWSDDLLILFL